MRYTYTSLRISASYVHKHSCSLNNNNNIYIPVSEVVQPSVGGPSYQTPIIRMECVSGGMHEECESLTDHTVMSSYLHTPSHLSVQGTLE